MRFLTVLALACVAVSARAGAQVAPVSAPDTTTAKAAPTSAPAELAPGATAAVAPAATPVPVRQSPTTGGSPEVFDHGIKYLGGVGLPDFKGHENWDNKMTITADSVLMVFADTMFKPMSFPVVDIKQITYGQAATRHTGRWVALGVLVAPVALFGVFHKSRHHFVAITYTQDGHDRGVYFEVNKDLFRNLLNTLSYRSGQPIYADEKDRKWLQTQGVMAQLDPEAKGEK